MTRKRWPRPRRTKPGVARLLDVLPAHLIPGGGPPFINEHVVGLQAEWGVVGGAEVDRLARSGVTGFMPVWGQLYLSFVNM